MSTTTLSCPEPATSAVALPRHSVWARAGGLIELTKPRIAVLELVVVFVAAMVSTSGPPSGWVLVNTLLGTALVASSASVFNQWRERHTDANMARTRNRPLPAGVLQSWEAATFGIVLGGLGTLLLLLFVNLTVAALGVLCWALYVLIYTPLKRRSPINTVVGAIAGAIPALMGAAAAGPLGMTAFALFMLLYLWQFPHFMAIAWLYRDDYANGGMKMLTVVDPTGHRAATQSLAGAFALIPVAWLLVMDVAGGSIAAGSVTSGNVYLIGVTLLGLAQAVFALQFHARRDDSSARWLLRASLVYLPAVLLLLLLAPMF